MASRIRANNIEINYRLDGPVDGPVVMLSNSLMSNYSMWDAQMEVLASTYRVLRYDQRGHGGTETTPGPYTMELLADDAYALTEVLGIDTIKFVGLSMGGFTGQLLAVNYPGKITSLALCDTACVMPPKSLWDERIEVARAKGMESLMPLALERWFTPPFLESDNEQIKKVRAMILGTGVEGYIGCAEAIRDMFICDRLVEISVPTLVLAGKDDPACPVSAAQELHDGISGSEFIVIPESAHLPNIEQAAAFNDVLTGFLQRSAR